MVDQKPVSILWQIFFAVFVPIADIWAFYRIKKLRKAILYIALPSLAFVLAFIIPITSMAIDANGDPEKMEQISDELTSGIGFGIMSIVIPIGSTGILIWTIYLVATWSEQWNKQFV
ncbi:hypothetical protein K0U27_02915 [archaeon]|nr:hypothetical protein [archaeon]